jgi:four helix bundle protein
LGDQRSCLRIAKKECFEAANILVILANENLISQECMELEYEKINTLCKRITAYANSLSRPKIKK